METPEAERIGKVFKLDGLRTRAPITAQKVCCILSKIGKKAGVVVATKEKQRRVDGKLSPVTVRKFASAHDLRRSFGTRWAKRVMPAVLKRLMRHSAVQTTLAYYVDLDTAEVADELWAKFGADDGSSSQGNKRGNIAPKNANGPDSVEPVNPLPARG